MQQRRSSEDSSSENTAQVAAKAGAKRQYIPKTKHSMQEWIESLIQNGVNACAVLSAMRALVRRPKAESSCGCQTTIQRVLV